MTSIDDIDLAALARYVRDCVPSYLRGGSVPGRTAVRNAIADHLGCSEMLAEDVVETMIARGFLILVGDERETEPPTWLVRPTLV